MSEHISVSPSSCLSGARGRRLLRGEGVLLVLFLFVLSCTRATPEASKKTRQRSVSRPPAPKRRPKRSPPLVPERGPLAQKILYQQAKGFLKVGRPEKAAALFRRAIEADRGDLLANAYLGLGSALSDMGKKDEAVEAFRKVVALRPKDVTAYQMLALGLRDVGALEDAAKALDAASYLDPDRLSLYQDLMALELDAKKTRAAQKVYERYEARRRALLRRLKDATEVRAREAAAVALGAARDDETARGLVAALKDPSARVRLAVIRALGQQGLAMARAPLRTYAKMTTSAAERRAIRQAIATIDNAPPAPTISRMPASAPVAPAKTKKGGGVATPPRPKAPPR